MTSPRPWRAAPREYLRRAYHSLRNLPDRLLHRRRHRDVLGKLSAAPRPKRILVVCYGNVCRSPYLEAVLQRRLSGTAVSSAGFVGSDRPVPENSLTISTKRGIDLSRFRSRPLTASIVSEAELIIVMDPDQAREIATRFRVARDRIVVAGDLDPTFQITRAIRDPWNQSIHVFESSFDRLDRCAATLVSVLGRSL